MRVSHRAEIGLRRAPKVETLNGFEHEYRCQTGLKMTGDQRGTLTSVLTARVRFESCLEVDSCATAAQLRAFRASLVLTERISEDARIIIRDDGTFGRVEEGQRAQELFLAALGPHLRVAEQVPALRDYVASMTPDKAMTTFQESEWRKLSRNFLSARCADPGCR